MGEVVLNGKQNNKVDSLNMSLIWKYLLGVPYNV